MLKPILTLAFLCAFVHTYAQQSSSGKYGLKTAGLQEYSAAIDTKPGHELVDLAKYIPSALIDIRYATENNFMHRKMYEEEFAFLRKDAADSLRVIQAELNKLGYGLKIYDAYRPYGVTVQFYEAYRDTTYVASPYSGSRHNRGCAVDLTLIELKTGKEVQMPTAYDDFSERAHAKYRDLPAKATRNRRLLQKMMTGHGFDIYPAEWWHFDFKGWQQYEVLDVPFAQLAGEQVKSER